MTLKQITAEITRIMQQDMITYADTERLTKLQSLQKFMEDNLKMAQVEMMSNLKGNC